MTKKDYIAFAAAFRLSEPSQDGNDASRPQWEEDVMTIAQVLERDSPRFDRAKFLKACGL